LLGETFTLTNGSVSFSASTESGFSIGLSGTGPLAGLAKRYLTLDNSADASLTVDLTGASAEVVASYTISSWNGTAWVSVAHGVAVGTTSLPGPRLSWTGALQAGSYQLSIAAGAEDGLFNGEVASFTVPAPGAMALLGAAGFMGRRRRN
jgi:hypothetical protein